MMLLAIYYGQTSVVRWLFDRNFCPTDEHLELTLALEQTEIIQTCWDFNTLSLSSLANGEEILVLAVRFGSKDIYWDLIKKEANVNCRDRNGRTLLYHAVWSSRGNSEIIEDLLLTGIDPIEQDNAGRTPLSLWIWDRHRPTSGSRLTGQFFKYPAIEDGKDVLRRLLQSPLYHTACLLLHYGLDLVLEDVDMRAKWTQLLMLPGLGSDISDLGDVILQQ